MTVPQNVSGAADTFAGERDLHLSGEAQTPATPAVLRLREAVHLAGGPAAVVAKAGIKNSTLRRLLNGQQARQDHLIALARAAGVRLEWLAIGDGPMRATRGFAEAGVEVATVPALPEPTKNPPSIWTGLDFDTLVMCLEFNEDLDKLGGGQLKSARSRLRRALNAYDLQKHDKE